MPATSATLRKILELELRKGFQNSAVMGGLDKFLQSWSEQMRSSMREDRSLREFSALFAPGWKYSLMDRSQRKEWSAKLLKWLDQLESLQLKPATTQPAIKTGLDPDSPRTKLNRAVKPRIGPPPNRQNLELPVATVRGISDALSKKFEKLAVVTIRDLLYFFPGRHIDYSQKTFINRLIAGQENTVVVNVWEAREVQLGTRRSTVAIVGDETGNIKIVWFNQPFMAKNLKTGQRIVVSGKVNRFNDMLQFESPEWEPYEDRDLVHTGRWVPIYPLTQGLSQRQVRRIMQPAVEQWCQQLEDFLPSGLRQRLRFLDLPEAIRQAHYPADSLQKNEARRRLAFDELFLLQLGVLKKKLDWQQSQPGIPFEEKKAELETFLGSLPYQLTKGQTKALGEILGDLKKPIPMSRLLQGEVGSGKTVVATAALISAVTNGFQGALMAPTEILAGQHFNTIRRVLSGIGQEEGRDNAFVYSVFPNCRISVALLTGDLPRAKKRKVQEMVSSGQIDIAIGTHALIQKEIKFARLGLAVIDEQHRFGVEQRSALRQKGTNPHVLVMTATPIPRTLALTLYGDMDLSLIDELPPGRQSIKTRWLKPEQRVSAYNFLHKQVGAGRQAFIICPLVEESESVQARAAIEEFEQLSSEIFPDLRLGLLHGRMSSEDKGRVMEKFHSGEIEILVSTPVVEVGIDVPNATVMLIESADRFGLSQLHQFRGRIGRGTEQSYCMLLSENPSDEGRERLALIEKTQNGFLLAEEDLKLRGPGEFFGTRQSGLPDLKMARLSDVLILETARKEAEKLFGEDPDLKKEENRLLSIELARVWQHISTEWSSN
jgi:ATP-dependent DNA helicase RecG